MYLFWVPLTCLSFPVFLYLSLLYVLLLCESFLRQSIFFFLYVFFYSLLFLCAFLFSVLPLCLSLLHLSFLCLSFVCFRVFSVGIFSSIFLFSVSIDRFLFHSCIPPVFHSVFIFSVSPPCMSLFCLFLLC